MEHQRTINELATWEIDSMIEMYGNKLLNLFPSLFDEYPHPEFCERSASVVFNNPVLCQKLRGIAKTCYDDSIRLVDEKDIRACLMPESEIRKRAEQNGC
jgi:hypothetical protein